MPRPKRCRRICCEPGYRYFKPQGIPVDSLDKRALGLDELEALRLADLEGLPQERAARMMDVSQPTFNRILAGARSKLAECLVHGLALRIESVGESKVQVDSGSVEPSSEGQKRRRGGCNR